MAISELLEVWRRTRDPAVAERIVEVEPQSELVVAFEAEKKGGLGGALARLDSFDAPGDPRVGRFLLMLLERYRPRDNAKSRRLHRRAFELLARHADVAIVDELVKLAETPRRTGRIVTSAWFETEVRGAIAALGRAVPAPIEADLPVLEAPSAPPGDKRAALYRAVYEAPDEDGPRAVLSDYLLEEGDAHGELIAAQLSGNDKRARTLLRTEAPRFADPRVWNALFRRSVTFERGFVASGYVRARSVADFDRAIGAEAWATVHTLRASYFAGWGSTPDETTRMLALLTHPAMRHLKHVGPIGYSELIALVEHGKPLPWRTLTVEKRTNDATEHEVEAARRHMAKIFPNIDRP